MKYLFLAGVAAMAGVGYFFFDFHTPVNVFPLTPAQTYEKLRAADISHDDDGPFGVHDVPVTSVAGKSVTWANNCTATIAPFENTQKSLVDLSCQVAGEGAAAGMQTAMRRDMVIEHIDATLKGRPYDKMRAAKGQTAAGWPADVVKHGNIFDAQGEALAMQADMEKMEADQARAQREQAKPPREQSFDAFNKASAGQDGE